MKTGVLSLPAELMALIVLVVLLLHQTCSAMDSNRDCVPSSCGNIPNIRFPFRLENDPPNCGNPSGQSMALLNCEKRVNSPWYLNKSTCFGNRAYASNSSSSQPEAGFRYVIYNLTNPGVLEDLCQVEQIFHTSWWSVSNLLPEDPSSISCTDLHNLLLYGFELYWSWTPDCGNCGIFEFSEQRYCCKRHTGILAIPFRVYKALRGILSDLYLGGTSVDLKI